MFKMPKKIVYALPEIIGNTDLFVGRSKEFDFFLGQWFQDLEKNFTQNQAIISRRKKEKQPFYKGCSIYSGVLVLMIKKGR